MLKLVNIKKDYKVADTTVNALRGVSICFRKNEFVSVLGPSGCGKTTLLNIIGGLDHVTSGDLTIYGKSTADYKDRDWDVYRNHRIGFVFQSYNLIPHQTVLGNVELALTIAGLSKEERVQRAKAALDKVGLSDQYYKRPNQLSGGQCQRVAIARALVNDPEILLADEPTGALDTVTSKQIMDLVKEIAKERLVIMVTHNPELAKEYSTRIVRLLDGNLLDDSNPFSEQDEKAEVKAFLAKEEKEKESTKDDLKQNKKVKKQKTKMSFFTALKLSLQNLFSKKKRTILTSVASSIGIIGISLVLSMSYGVKSYIKTMQNDMLSGNPITITESAFDLSSMMGSTMEQAKVVVADGGFINVDAMIKSLAKRAEEMDNMMIENNIKQEYVDYIMAMPKDSRAAITMDYGFDITNNLYMDFYETIAGEKADNGKNISLTALRSIYTKILKDNPKTASYAGLIMGLSDVFMQAPNSEDYIMSQYNLLDGDYARGIDEVMIVVQEGNTLTDLLLAQLGYYNQEQFVDMVYRATDENYVPAVDANGNPVIPQITRFSYEQLKGRTFTYYPNDTVLSGETGIPITPFNYYADSSAFCDGSEQSITANKGIQLRVVGILQPKKDMNYGSLETGFYYTEELAKHIVEENINSKIIDYMIENNISEFNNIPSEENPLGTTIPFRINYLKLNGQRDNLNDFLGRADTYSSIFSMLGFGSGNDYEIKSISLRELSGGKIIMGEDEEDEDKEVIAGVEKLPNYIAIYSTNLAEKDKALSYLNAWNNQGRITVGDKVFTFEEREKMVYSDTLSLIFSMISMIIDVITYALIGFTCLALVVSCVMIAIVTYISVVERTKEIGVIRSLGGRKLDVSMLFIAETGIIGLAAGLIAIAFTYLMSGLINLITGLLASITIAVFPFHYAVIMLALSVGLTLVSGLFPSSSAAKKDPVVALRTE